MRPYINKPLTKGRLKQLVAWSLHVYGVESSVALVERLKNLGFAYATIAGLSLGVDDLTVPGAKVPILASSESRLRRDAGDVDRGLLTPLQYFGRVITVWNGSNETLKDELLAAYRRSDSLNPVLMMAFSGARGNISQVRQLVGMRGLMADATGQIKDFAVQSNFREGLSLTEYLIACYGSRKGVVDTALKTATSGYLTRRLVDVAQHVVVTDVDCGSRSGFNVTGLVGGGRVLLSLRSRLIGRVLCADFTDSRGTLHRNREIDHDDASRLTVVPWVNLRSPLTCLSKRQVCRRCYGWNLALGRLVGLGETVGVMAAQSIGEPGTQLTMRTFHTGGVFSGGLSQAYRSPDWCPSGRVVYPEPVVGLLVRDPVGAVAYLTKTRSSLVIVGDSGPVATLTLPSHSLMTVKQGQRVSAGHALGESADVSRGYSDSVRTIPSRYRGEVKTPYVVRGRAHRVAHWDGWPRSRRVYYDRRLRGREEWATPTLLKLWRSRRRRHHVDSANSAGSYFWVVRGERQTFSVPGVCLYEPGDRFASRVPLVWRRMAHDPSKVRPGPLSQGPPLRTHVGYRVTVASWAAPYGFTRDAPGVRVRSSVEKSSRRGPSNPDSPSGRSGATDPDFTGTDDRSRSSWMTRPLTSPSRTRRGACDRFRSHRVVAQPWPGHAMGRLQSTVSELSPPGSWTTADDGGSAYPDWSGEFHYVLAYRSHPKYLRRRSRGTKYYHSQRVARSTQIHELSQTYVALVPRAVSYFDHDLTTRVRHALSNGLDRATTLGQGPVYPLARLSPTDLIAQPERGRRGVVDRPGGLYTQQVVVPLPYDRTEISGLTYVRTHRVADDWVARLRVPSFGSVEFRLDSRDRLGPNSGSVRFRVLRPYEACDRREVRCDRRRGALRASILSGLHSRSTRARRPAFGLPSTSVANRASDTGVLTRRTRWAQTDVRGTSGRTPSAPSASLVRTWSEIRSARVGLGKNVMVMVRRRAVSHPTRGHRHDRVVDVMRPVRIGRGYGRGRVASGNNAGVPCLSWGESKSRSGAYPGDDGSAGRGWGFDGQVRYGSHACQTVVRGRRGSVTSSRSGLWGPARRHPADWRTPVRRVGVRSRNVPLYAGLTALPALRLTIPAGQHGSGGDRKRYQRLSMARFKIDSGRVVHDASRRSAGPNPVNRAFGSWPRLRRGFARVRRPPYRRLGSTDTRRRVWPYLTVQVTHAPASGRSSVSPFPSRRDAYGRRFLLCHSGGAHERTRCQPRSSLVGLRGRKLQTVEARVNDRSWRFCGDFANTWFRRRSRMTDTNLIQIQCRVVRTRLVYDTGGKVRAGWASRLKPNCTWCGGSQVPTGATMWSRRRRPERIEVPAAEPRVDPMTVRPAARTWMVAGSTRLTSMDDTTAGGDASGPRATEKVPVKVYDQRWPRYQPNLNLDRIEPDPTRSWRCAWVGRDFSRHAWPRPIVRDRESIRGMGQPDAVRATHPVGYGVTIRRDESKTVQTIAQHRQPDRQASNRRLRTCHLDFGPFGSTVMTPLTGTSGPHPTRDYVRAGSGDSVKPQRERRGRHVMTGHARRAWPTRTTQTTAWDRERSPRPGVSDFWSMTAVDYGLRAGLKRRNPPFVKRHGVRSGIGHGRPPAAGDASWDRNGVGWTARVHSGWCDTLTPYAIVPTGRCGTALCDPSCPDRSTVVAPAAGELIYGGSSRKSPTYVASPTKPWPVNGRPADELRYLTTACVIHYRHNAARTNLTIGGYVHVESRVDGNRRNRTAGQVLTVSGSRVTLRRGRHYRIPTHSRCDVSGDAWVERGQGLMAVRYRNLMTGDIVQGIPKVERVFEARTNVGLASLPALLTRVYDRFNVSTPSQVRLRETVVSRSLHSVVRFALNAVQGVYQSQGVNIADKHVEIILRQMTAKVSITYPGDSGLLFGDLVYVAWIRHLMSEQHRDGRYGPSRGPRYRPPLYVPCIHGITRTALGAQGFLAAASFQETTRILAQAAAAGRRDFLRGLKGNVILGARLPMGTGMMSWRNRPDSGTRPSTEVADPCAPPKRFLPVGATPAIATARGRRLRTPGSTTDRRRSTVVVGRPAYRGRGPRSRRLVRVFGPPIASAFGSVAAESFRLLRSTNWRVGFAGPHPGPPLPTTPRLTRLRYGRLRLLRRYGYGRLYRTAIRHEYLALGLKPRDPDDRARPRRRPRRRRGRGTYRGSRKRRLRTTSGVRA